MEIILIVGFVVVGIYLGQLLGYLKNIDRNLQILNNNTILFGNTATYEKRLEYMKKSAKGEQEYVELMNVLNRLDRESERLVSEYVAKH